MFACATIPLNFIKKLSLEKTVPLDYTLTISTTLLIPWCSKLSNSHINLSLIFANKATRAYPSDTIEGISN